MAYHLQSLIDWSINLATTNYSSRYPHFSILLNNLCHSYLFIPSGFGFDIPGEWNVKNFIFKSTLSNYLWFIHWLQNIFSLVSHHIGWLIWIYLLTCVVVRWLGRVYGNNLWHVHKLFSAYFHTHLGIAYENCLTLFYHLLWK